MRDTSAAPAAGAPSGSDAKRARPRRGCGALLAVGSLLLSLALAEAALRVAHPLPDPYARYKTEPLAYPNTPYVPSAWAPGERIAMRAEPGLPGVDTTRRWFTTNALGFRGGPLAIPKPAGEVRVFMVGGSTTECFFLDDREAVSARLQAYLRQALPGANVRVYAAAHSGDRSWDHVAMVSQRIAHLQPDVIVVFAGINDVNAGITGRDYLMRDVGKPLQRGTLAKMVVSELQVARLVHLALAPRPARARVITSEVGKAAERVRSLPVTPFPHRPDPAPYAANLATLAGIARAHGARMVMMTQATTWMGPDPRARRWFWLGGTRAHHPEAALDSAMRQYNRAMIDVGARQGVPVYDLFNQIPRTTEYFYDDVHFNVRGADTAARQLARFMVEQGVFGRVRAASAAAGPW
ncbi:MAG TPA: SGNH/GDSL hydrolase family protein [Longimicrobium sp.]|nr:SGNH/GDSL hydrolase family protein [Longimicrobium sp.]